VRTVDPWRGWIAVRVAWILGLVTWAVIYPWFMWDYMFSLPLMMVFASAAGPVLRLAAQRPRCRRCGLELDGSYERSLLDEVVLPLVARTPEVALGRSSVEAGTPIRGRLILPAGRAVRDAYVRVRSCIAPVDGGPRREILGPRVKVGEDGRFVLTAPRHPVSGRGELVGITHRVEAAISYGRGAHARAEADLAVVPRTIHARRRRAPDGGYRDAAAPERPARGLFDGLMPGDVPDLLAERHLGRYLSRLWADGMHVVPGARKRKQLAALGSASIFALGVALSLLLPISLGATPVIIFAAAIISLMAWEHFRPRRDVDDEPFERCRVRLRVSGAVALADAVHVRVEVPEGDRGAYHAELIKRERATPSDVTQPSRDTIRRIPAALAARDDGQLEGWLELPADEMPTLVDHGRHSVRWSVQVRRDDELMAEHPVCVLPVRLKAS
jgi:hypothetical protein